MGVQIHTIITGKNYGSKEDYVCFDTTNENVPSVQSAKKLLKERYGRCKKIKIYKETKDSKDIHIGWVYCFNNNDISHNSKTWHQQDWVYLNEITPVNL